MRMAFRSSIVVITLLLSVAQGHRSPRQCLSESLKNLINGAHPSLFQFAGDYFRVNTTAGDVKKCVKSCCTDQSCHVAFMMNNETCFKISCANGTACEPVDNSGNSTHIYVPVRDIMSGNDTCASDDECSKNEYCQKDEGVCSCIEGYQRSREPENPACVLESSEPTASSLETTIPVSMEARSSATTEPEAKEPMFHFASLDITGPEEVHLPVEKITLGAKANLIDPFSQTAVDENEIFYSWSWSSLSEGLKTVDNNSEPLAGEEKQPLSDHWNQASLVISKISVGRHKFCVTAKFKLVEKQSCHEIRVIPEEKENKPPKSIIQPPNKILHARVGETRTLDGSMSKDDDGKIVSYSWRLLSGPAYQPDTPNSATLRFDSPSPGNYTFQLSVTDDKGAADSENVTIVVDKARDDPPKAVAGQCGKDPGDVTLRLPINHLFLCGNSSTDDNGIVSWSWVRTDRPQEDEPLDVKGSDTPSLEIFPSHPGNYEFRLTVKDKMEQEDVAFVHVVVLPAENKPPVSRAGSNKTITLPENSIVLDGSGSSDDGSIEKFYWSQISGAEVSILNRDKPKITVSNLQEGLYGFRLNVTDEKGLMGSSNVYITVLRSKNSPPIIHANDTHLTYPANFAKLNASASTDDAGIIRWKWELTESSPAAINILGNTYQEPILYLSILGPGRFVFNLTVWDQGSLGTWKLVNLTVAESEADLQAVEISSQIPLMSFTVRQRNRLHKILEALLTSKQPGSSPVSISIVISEYLYSYEYSNPGTKIIFSAHSVDTVTTETKVLPAVVVVKTLNAQMDAIQEFNITNIGSKYCHNLCSGRGVCSNVTKNCLCDHYWMPNLFSTYVLHRKSNCDWSVLYFILTSLLVTFLLIGFIWFIMTSLGCCRLLNPPITKTHLSSKRLRRRARPGITLTKSKTENGDAQTARLLSISSDDEGGGDWELEDDWPPSSAPETPRDSIPKSRQDRAADTLLSDLNIALTRSTPNPKI